MTTFSMTANDRIKQLNAKITVEYSDAVNLTSYFRVCRSMLIMANQYEKENALERAYALKKKFVILFLTHLSARPDFLLVDQQVRSTWTKECSRVLKSVEQLSYRLQSNYEAEEKVRIDAEKAAAEKKRIEEEKVAQAKIERERRDAANKELPNSVSAIVSPILPSIQPPAYDRSIKPMIPSTPKNGMFGWSSISVPKGLADRFLEITAPNSQLNIETCATLCGHISGSGFVISHLVFCKQAGTADSCITTCEEELIECIDKESLIALGWIHTHPTQTVFMSSLDLHCQLSYQLMLPEAIAIVCSPRYNDVQYFSITPDYGIKFLLECKHTGFHKHATTRDLYINSPHLVIYDEKVKVIDLR